MSDAPETDNGFLVSV